MATRTEDSQETARSSGLEQLERALLESVCARVRGDASEAQGQLRERFVRRFYHWAQPEDLIDRSPEDLSGTALAALRLASERRAGEALVRVYNPSEEHDGWGTPNTAIDIVCDDMPFLVDSVNMTLSRGGHGVQLLVHPVLGIERDEEGRLVDLREPLTAPGEGAVRNESVIHAEVDREADAERLTRLEDELSETLEQVRTAVEDWPEMRARLHDAAAELAAVPAAALPEAALAEARAFLEWLDADHFVFIGYREYELASGDELNPVATSGLGTLRRGPSEAPSRSFAKLPEKAKALAHDPDPLVLTKLNRRSPIHRNRYLDYVGVKRFDDSGRVIGERRFLGLYTSLAVKQSPRSVPILRGKVAEVIERAGFPPGGHDAKSLQDILEDYPREELFETGAGELFRIALGILALNERHRVGLFVRRDPYERLVSCLVYLPRERFNTDSRERIATVLRDAFGGTEAEWTVQVSESLLVRLHYVVRLGEHSELHDVAEIEARVVEATRSWVDNLERALLEAHAEARARTLLRRYRDAFPPAYRADWTVAEAVADLDRIEAAGDRDTIALYRHGPSDELRLRLYSRSRSVALSEVMPIFERMGVTVGDERPYEIVPRDGQTTWLYDFGIRCLEPRDNAAREHFERTFLETLHGRIENDRLNALVLSTPLSGREVAVLRAVTRYLRQAGSTFSDRYLQQALTGHPVIAALFVDLFHARFDPERRSAPEARRIEDRLAEAIDRVESLDADRILRSYLTVLRAMTRTNYHRERPYLSFKLDSGRIPFLPEPYPRFEIFVYSPRFEGVHLRGGKVARGGLRWSDRAEDFRTEILGLMKAQMVKNALIVPVGAKGGFVLKRAAEDPREEARDCYSEFVRGLLDLTDNIEDGRVVPPPRTVRYDDDDPYLVVAADKGTATLSDTANEIAAEYGFWLGDAFASGGSNGYDHKAMGITARGCWESVKRAFRELDSHALEKGFTAVGIGDMSGDVFGNGMLLSRKLRLVAAFNHEHIFIDPDPDPEAGYEERKRLFERPRSSWADYDEAKISDGGGVFERSTKSIRLSPQAREALDVDRERLAPSELIKAILRAPVDLLWNGGIGTYVKASAESHAEVGDRANDQLRVDAEDLRCRVIGEGGNLGVTQRGRIEYALRGGHVNTDAIDNAGGVACSDDEVNLKILLDAAVRDGLLDRDGRDGLLAELEPDVAERVISQCYTQTLGLSLERAQSATLEPLHARLVGSLEQQAGLDRKLEYLPSDEELRERRAGGRGLTAPELAVLLAYTKIGLYGALLESDLPEDEHLQIDLARSFPAPLPQRFGEQMRGHRLRREITATIVAGSMVDRVGTTFVFRLVEETGASAADLARAYAVTLDVFHMRDYWREVEALDDRVPTEVQSTLLFDSRRLVTRATRWLARNCGRPIDIAATGERFATAAGLVAGELPGILAEPERQAWHARVAELTEAGVPDALARRAAGLGAVFSALDVVLIAEQASGSLEEMTAAYFTLGGRLQLDWLRDRILELPREDRWQALARAALRDDLYALHRRVTAAALECGLDAWLAETPGIERYLRMLAEIRANADYGVTALSVAVREASELAAR